MRNDDEKEREMEKLIFVGVEFMLAALSLVGSIMIFLTFSWPMVLLGIPLLIPAIFCTILGIWIWRD